MLPVHLLEALGRRAQVALVVQEVEPLIVKLVGGRIELLVLGTPKAGQRVAADQERREERQHKHARDQISAPIGVVRREQHTHPEVEKNSPAAIPTGASSVKEYPITHGFTKEICGQSARNVAKITVKVPGKTWV